MSLYLLQSIVNQENENKNKDYGANYVVQEQKFKKREKISSEHYRGAMSGHFIEAI